jgi:hypothetical protein
MENIVQQSPPNLLGVPNPEFEVQLLDAAVWQKGYDCLVHKAIECPCKLQGQNSNLPTCTNCGGTGWVFINPTQTKALITSINKDTKYKNWSQELIGTMSITLRDVERASFMDRVTFINETGIFSEVKTAYTVDTDTFIFLSYEAALIEDIFIFAAQGSKLIRVDPTKYYIKTDNNAVVVFLTGALTGSTNNSISVRYRNKVQYNVLDIPHMIRSSNITNELGQITKVTLPNQYIARLAHYVRGLKYDGTGIQDNSYDR